MATLRQILGHRSRRQQILKFLTISGLSAAGDSVYVCMRVCMCACMHVHVCVRACVHACVNAVVPASAPHAMPSGFQVAWQEITLRCAWPIG